MIVFGVVGNVYSQYLISGKVLNEEGEGIPSIEVHDRTVNQTVVTNKEGLFEMAVLVGGIHEVLVFGYEYNVARKKVFVEEEVNIQFTLTRLSTELNEVTVQERREEFFNTGRLEMVEGTSIFAGKKTEVVLMDQMVGNKAANNARQIYSQVVGLNIYESGDAGLQLSIGGRGLDPNRTANFNTRQNGYDISADVLGYPESYYTPPAEALEEIQIVRGAASLQYGTQFGGLINFKMKRSGSKPVEVVGRQSLGSFNLFSSFNSVSGTLKKFSYYTYYHRKSGDGFRPNSRFASNNFFGTFRYQLSTRTKVTFDYTHLDYLAQQPGGLTDQQFEEDPLFSNRTRNWFQVNWNLFALKLEHEFSTQSEFSLMLFGLDASRDALGFRGDPGNLNSNPITAEDPQENGAFIYARDLIKGRFRNLGVEVKFLTRYSVGDRSSVLLLGTKLYAANNTSRQGPGSNLSDADFTFDPENVDYPNQSSFRFPNQNVSLFGENIFFINDRFSVTPGFRFEAILTESEGTYNQVNFDNAGNPISNQFLEDNRSLDRSFVLFGVGVSYRPTEATELYSNFSQNYRSVTFSDIRTVSPTFIIDPDIQDEKGFTADLGIRGRMGRLANFDVGTFGLLYDDRIGIILDDRANRVRKNIGKAFIYGLELFGDINLFELLSLEKGPERINWFLNAAITGSKYLSSEENNVAGNRVEFIPTLNLKSGLNIGYEKFQASLQWTLLTKQFTDVENSNIADETDSRNGLIGEIPGYDVIDISFAYTLKKFTFESGINNLLDESYFTRRATGYPGPGIIPSEPRSIYLTVQIKI